MSALIKKFTALILTLSIVFSQNIVSAPAKSSNVSRQNTLTVNNTGDTGSLASDAKWGNFRNVKAGKIGRFNLFRSQHPANGSTRSYHANKLAKVNAIRTVLNLSDTDKRLNSYFQKYKIDSTYYYKSLYDKGSVYTVNICSIFRPAAYQKKTVECMRFISKRKGPYLVHCEVGRDRTAFEILVIECLMGATYTYMLNDDAMTFINREGKSYAEARKISVPRLNETFHYITGKPKNTNWGKVNLSYYAELYLKKGGMSPAEITALKRNLSINYPEGGINYNLRSVPKNLKGSNKVPAGSSDFNRASKLAEKDNTKKNKSTEK